MLIYDRLREEVNLVLIDLNIYLWLDYTTKLCNHFGL